MSRRVLPQGYSDAAQVTSLTLLLLKTQGRGPIR
jgi:hypothetical protein